VICTPHVAGVTHNAMRAMGVMAAECVIAALQGREVPADRVVVPGRAPGDAVGSRPTPA
jgi:phosphoglycerate dehydrogenase-like enzyme